jgi:type II restriction enzyme
MAKAINSITKFEDLITSRERTRAGFISMALEKGYLAKPYIEEAKTLKALASQVKDPRELLKKSELRVGLLTASGLSDKALNYLNEDDRTKAIKGLIDEFLIPANDNFPDELVYRFLLTKGDTLGGRARNLAGALGEKKFLRSMLSVFNLAGIKYNWRDDESKSWLEKPKDDVGIESRIGGLYWNVNKRHRLLLLNLNVPVVRNNIDISILDGKLNEIENRTTSIINLPERYLALGELKGGIDPAGADEHWKTANSALVRIRNRFAKVNHVPYTFFIGAAIEKAMAQEIFNQLQAEELTKACNLTDDTQLSSICEWIIKL